MKNPSLSAYLVDQIRSDILNGNYAPETQLRQDALAERYEVSRIPVREALLQLEGEGFVTIFPRRGAIVTKLSDMEINDIFDLRRLLELRLYRASAPRLGQAELDAAKEIHQCYAAAVDAGGANALGSLNAAFHQS